MVASNPGIGVEPYRAVNVCFAVSSAGVGIVEVPSPYLYHTSRLSPVLKSTASPLKVLLIVVIVGSKVYTLCRAKEIIGEEESA